MEPLAVKTWPLLAAAVLLMALGAPAAAAEFFVAPDGDDANPGDRERPFATVTKAAAAMRAGDICWLRGGMYREDVVLSGLRGREDAPITFASWEGEKATFDGTVDIRRIGGTQWARYKGAIRQTTLDRDIWQLFDGREMLTQARWPNARMTDEDFWNQQATFRRFGEGSAFGLVVDARPDGGVGAQGPSQDEGASPGERIPDGVNTQSLAETGVDMTGAIAILNMGSWMTWAQRIQEHNAGSNTFAYDTDFRGHGRSDAMARAVAMWCGNEQWWFLKNIKNGQGCYFLEGLPCLDRPGEWWFDAETRVLYLIPPAGKTAAEMELRGKAAIYALALEDCSHVVFRGIDFFGATFRLDNCDHVAIEDADLLYPNTNRRVLDELGEIPCTIMRSPVDRVEPNRNVLRNCRFAYTDGAALVVDHDRGDRIENCLFHDIDSSCIGDGMTVRLNGEDTTIRRCTVYNAGGSECVYGVGGVHIQLCRFWRIGQLQHDGGATQFGSFQRHVEVDHCWSHDHFKNGFRFDGGGGPPRPPSQLGVMHHNVTWNTGGMSVKGDRHLIHNNVVWRTTKGLVILVWPPMNGVNNETITINNLSPIIDTRWWGADRPPLPGVANANCRRDPTEVLRDPEHLDFRPRADARDIADAGTIDEAKAHPGFDGIEYLGEAPDIGAYEFGATRYWIPGYQYPCASTPIPPDGATNVAADADLMFLEGSRAEEHALYFGASPQTMTKQAVLTDTNIFTPPALESGAEYFWRVDAVRKGQIVPGPTWRFRTRPGTPSPGSAG